jgi:CRISPR/Cas system CMR subunit Cmr4 (Cas7 group RAMP superfamily)
VWETAIAYLTVLIHGIVASGQCYLTEAVPASTVLTHTSIQTSLDNHAQSDKDCHWASGKASGLLDSEIIRRAHTLFQNRIYRSYMKGDLQ